MKKSHKVTLTLVAALGAASGNQRKQDPCQPATFNQQECQQAVTAGGYYWNGLWTRMKYRHPYPYYYDSYQRFVEKGGQVRAAPLEAYRRPDPAAAAHGGFGVTGADLGAGG
jgi:hypothetical protein